MFQAKVIQYMLPNGRQKGTETDLPDDAKADYDAMMAHGCRLEAEVLTTGEVSITVTNAEQDVDFSVSPNGPDVQPGMVAMLKRRAWAKTGIDTPRQTR